MANNRTITAANAILMLSVPGLYNTPRRIQGFTADNITEIDDLTIGEGQMGVDGHLSRGYVINAVNQTIALKADSESVDFFENLIESSRQQREAYVINGSILLRAVGKRVVMENGVLISASTMPAIGKTLGDRRFRFMWEKVTPSPN